MKTTLLVLVLLLYFGANSNSQKKNGVVYSKHEAIEKTVELWKAFEVGDKETYLSYYADSVYIFFNGNKSGWTKENLGKSLEWWKSSFENLKLEDDKPAYPDAIEYKEGGLWVQDWQRLTARHVDSGINVNLPIHHLYSFNKDGKISSIHWYFNNDVFESLQNSGMTEENGKVYINHPYILTVRKLVNSIIDKDLDKWSSFYTPDATFANTSMKYGESITLEENKEWLNKNFITSGKEFKVEQVGYPDCIYYEKNDMYVVYAWWKMSIKKDGKKYAFSYMVSYDFDSDGKVTRENIYASSNHLEGW